MTESLSPSRSGPTLRSLLIGALGAMAIGAVVPYCNMVLHGSRIASYFNTPIAIILFFFLVLYFLVLVFAPSRSSLPGTCIQKGTR